MGDLLTFPTRRRHNPLLSKKRIAERLECSPRTIERRISEGMPHERIEGVVYVRLQTALDWEEERNAEAS